MATQGTATLDFGAFPGASDASLAVASAGITGSQLVECWIFPATTPDHSADEHWVDSLKVMAGNVQAGVGFTIYGINTNTLSEPIQQNVAGRNVSTGQAFGAGRQDIGVPQDTLGGKGTRLYGKFNIGWVYN